MCIQNCTNGCRISNLVCHYLSAAKQQKVLKEQTLTEIFIGGNKRLLSDAARHNSKTIAAKGDLCFWRIIVYLVRIVGRYRCALTNVVDILIFEFCHFQEIKS